MPGGDTLEEERRIFYVAMTRATQAALESEESEVWFYRYSENPEDPDEEPQMDYIEDDDEYEKV